MILILQIAIGINISYFTSLGFVWLANKINFILEKQIKRMEARTLKDLAALVESDFVRATIMKNLDEVDLTPEMEKKYRDRIKAIINEQTERREPNVN